MSEIFLNQHLLIYFAIEFLLAFLGFIAFGIAFKIARKWDINQFSSAQFKLEKQNYLFITLAQIILLFSLFDTFYFIYVIDRLHLFIPGAMCAAGVINANSFGVPLLLFKLFLIFLLLLWQNINWLDLQEKTFPYTKIKASFFIVIFFILLGTIFLDINYFLHLKTNLPVSCCSTLYGQLEGQNPLPFNLDIKLLLVLFYLLFIVLIGSLAFEIEFLTLFSTPLFLYIAYYAVTYFFGTYIYELPTHKCPFCMFQKEYFYVGYLVWGSLFLGTFLALIWAIDALFFKIFQKKLKAIAQISLLLFVIICSSYVASYYFKNGVFL